MPYLYNRQKLEPWVNNVKEIGSKTKKLRIYFNNHYVAKAVENALEFKEMVEEAKKKMTKKESEIKQRISNALTNLVARRINYWSRLSRSGALS